jgi:hypothetical protein
MEEMNEDEMMEERKRFNELFTAELKQLSPADLLFVYLEAKLGENASNTPMPFGSSLEVTQKIQDLLDAYSVQNN